MEPIKKFSPAFYGVIILLFFLPFVNLSCSGQTIMSLTGLQLITGAEYSEANMFGQNMFENNNNANMKNNREIESQPLALLAFVMAIAGLIISLGKKKLTYLLCLIISALGAVFLFLLKINIDGDAELNGQGIVKLEYQAGYWLSLLVFIATVVFFWMIFKEKENVAVVTNEPPPDNLST
jgi:hypothetical protein